MPRFAALCLACSGIACAYGPTVGPPPGPVPDRDPTGQPQPAGELAPVVGHGAQRVIAAGIYRGDLTIDGNGNVVQGAGIDRTIVRGNLTIHGDANVVHSLRILGERTIEGQDNDVRGTAFGEPEPPAPPDPAPPTPTIDPTADPTPTAPANPPAAGTE
jgi:hypothetical protein